LDFIHRLVSQKNWGIKYIYQKITIHTSKIHTRFNMLFKCFKFLLLLLGHKLPCEMAGS
jgi:hypothetical protein